MALEKPPLFMQAGKYTAAADRFLIGAGLYPKGGNEMYPRPGVQPFSVTSLSDSTELSFRVVPRQGGGTAGDVTVLMGAAYVAGPATKVLNGVYLVVNNGDHDLSLGTILPGAARNVDIYVQVLDAEITIPGTPDDPQPSTLAEATFVMQDANLTTKPSDSLLLARVSLNTSNAVGTITDLRTYTTSHGGVLLVSGKTDLELDNMKRLPLGSQVYSITDKAILTRTPDGWTSLSVLPVSATRPQDANVSSGYMYFNTVDRTVNLFNTVPGSGGQMVSTWYTVGQAVGMVRRTTETDYTAASRHRHLPAAFVGKTTLNTDPDSDTYHKVEELGGSGLTTENLTIRFLVQSKDTLITAAIGAEMTVWWKANSVVAPASWAEMILVLKKYNTIGGPSTAVTAVPEYDYTNPTTAPGGANRTAWMDVGLRARADFEAMAGRTVLYSLDPGEYQVYPMFRVTGFVEPGTPADTTERWIRVMAMTIDVTL